MREYPPAHVIHEADCEDNPGGLRVFRASFLRDLPNARPHRCFSRATIAYNRQVVAEPVEYGDHAYRPSTIRPPDATKALCDVCRGTHGEVDLREFLGLTA